MSSGSDAKAGGKISNVALVCYGIGEISITVGMVLIGLFVLFFYNSVLGLSGTLVGIGSAIGLIFEAMIDPYVGYRSDKSKSTWGRRHSFMFVGAATLGLSFWMLMSPPQEFQTVHLFLWLVIASLLFRTASATYRIPYLSLGAEFSTDYHQRTIVVGVRSFLGLVGTLLAATLSFALFFPEAAPGVDPKLNYSSYPKMGFWFGALMTLAGMVAVFGTYKYRHISAPVPMRKKREEPFVRSFLLALKIRSFRYLWLSFSLFLLAVVLTSVTAVHYYNWYAEIEDSSVIGKIQACFYIGALCGVFLWVKLSKRFDKHRLCIVSILVTAAILLCSYFLVGKGNYFGTGSATIFFTGNFIAGVFGSAVWVLPDSMLADITDEDALETGQRREGIFFGIFAVGGKLATGLAVLLSGVLIQHYVNLVPEIFEQTEQVRERIGIVFGVVPAALLLVASVLVMGYRLDRKSIADIQTSLGQVAE